MGHFVCCWPTKCCQSLWLHDVISTVYRHRDGIFCCLINCIERNDILIFLSHSQAGNNMGEVECSLQPIKRKQKITKWVKIKSDNYHFLNNNLLAGDVLTLCLPWPTRVGILHWGASAVEKPPLTVLVPLSITMLCPITPSCLLSGFMAGEEVELEEGSGKLAN